MAPDRCFLSRYVDGDRALSRGQLWRRCSAIRNIVQTNGCVQLRQSFAHAGLAYDVISGDMGVASIDAGSNRNQAPQAIEHFGYLLEAATQRVFRACSVFNEDGETYLREVESLSCGRNCR